MATNAPISGEAATRGVDQADFRQQKIQQVYGVGPNDPREELEKVLYSLALEKLGGETKSRRSSP